MSSQTFQFKEANSLLLEMECWILKASLYMLWPHREYPEIKAGTHWKSKEATD